MVGHLVGSEDKALPRASSLLQWYLLLEDGVIAQFYYPSIVFSVFASILLKRSQISINNSFFHLVTATKLYIKQHLKITIIISLRMETTCSFLSLTTPIQTERGPTTSVRFQRRVMAT